MKNIWLDGVMGVVVGDALGCPVQFMSREEIARRPKGPVTGMEGHGTYNKPEGTWTDDGSMTLALLDSIREKKDVDLDDIMSRFVAWYEKGAYTPFGEPFDMGNTCSRAIELYENGTPIFFVTESAISSQWRSKMAMRYGSSEHLAAERFIIPRAWWLTRSDGL